jgi:hypothetical protein
MKKIHEYNKNMVHLFEGGQYYSELDSLRYKTITALNELTKSLKEDTTGRMKVQKSPDVERGNKREDPKGQKRQAQISVPIIIYPRQSFSSPDLSQHEGTVGLIQLECKQTELVTILQLF